MIATPFANVTASAGLGGSSGGSGLAWSDFDGDGDLDFVVPGASGVRLYRNAGDGSFAETATQLGLSNEPASAAAWGDFDGDGRSDLLLATTTGPRLWRNGTSGFTEVTDESGLPALTNTTVVAWADVDGDGDFDCFVASPDGSQVLRNEGGTFVDATAEIGLEGLVGVRVASWADADGDGLLDLFVATTSGGRVYLQTLGGRFEAGLSTPGASDAAWTDVNGDGRLDLVVATGQDVRLYERDEDGSYADATSTAGLSGLGGSYVAVDDSNGDGRIDVLATSASGVRLFRGSGSGFADKTSDSGFDGADGGPASWADVDGDGHVDLVIVSSGGVSVWRNPSASATLSVRGTLIGGADALGATIRFDGDGSQSRVVSGGGTAVQAPARAVFGTSSPASGPASVTYVGGVGRQRTVTTGTAQKLALERPASAPTVAVVSVKRKNGVDKLLLDGEGLVTNVAVVEVDGSEMDTTKYPKKKRNADGTSSRIVGTDGSFGQLVPTGRRVLVTVFDSSTGVRSAPASFVRE